MLLSVFDLTGGEHNVAVDQYVASRFTSRLAHLLRSQVLHRRFVAIVLELNMIY